MRTICLMNPLLPLPCEKSTLFRHGFLCPKIEGIPMVRPGMAQLITFPVSVSEIFQFKTGITAPDFLFLNHKKWQRRN